MSDEDAGLSTDELARMIIALRIANQLETKFSLSGKPASELLNPLAFDEEEMEVLERLLNVLTDQPRLWITDDNVRRKVDLHDRVRRLTVALGVPDEDNDDDPPTDMGRDDLLGRLIARLALRWHEEFGQEE